MMNWLRRITPHVTFGYQAVEDTTKRRKPVRRTSTEAAILTPTKREMASATAREDRRNMSLLAWMVRRHLDNVSRFTPHFRIPGDSPEAKAVNEAVKKLLAWHGRRMQFDARGLHGRDEWLRMFEATKILSGDCFGLKASGGKLQGIEGDRVCKPGASDVEGAKAAADARVDDEGIVFAADGVTREAYCVCKRDKSNLVFERIVPAADMIFDAYWPERFDSNRGVSPLLTALNEAADVRETWEWLVLKAKVSALFGLAFTRTDSSDPLPTRGEEPTSAPETESAAYSAQVTAAVKSRGIINLDLDPGDEVKEIGSDTPNSTVIPFTRELVRSVLLALDIPFTMYDSLASSFSARIADRNEYEESCEWKRDKNADVLNEVYAWLFPKWAKADLHGFGKTLKAANMQPEEVAAQLRWVPAGRPWLDRSNEMSGHILALAAGVTSTPRICAAYGDDAYQIAAEQKEYLAKAGIPLLYGQGGQVPVNDLLRQAREGTIREEEPAERPEEGSDDE